MLVQIHEVTTPEEASALGHLGVDHIGVLVGNGAFPRERSIDQASLIFSAIPLPSKGVALSLSADMRLVEQIVSELRPPIIHLGASTDLLTPDAVQQLKTRCGPISVMRIFPLLARRA
jgi:phosphoribosylanthranilate isomerase